MRHHYLFYMVVSRSGADLCLLDVQVCTFYEGLTLIGVELIDGDCLLVAHFVVLIPHTVSSTEWGC